MSIYKQLSLFGAGSGKLLGSFTEDERLNIKRKIIRRFQKKLTGHITIHINRDAQISLLIEYMYGNKYHIIKSHKGRKQPLNLWSSIDEIIDIIEREKYS